MYDLVILGGGPAGYLAAERAGHAGMSVAVIEKREVGGVCLNEGCIPSKSLLNSAKIFDSARHGAAFGVISGDIRLDHAAVMKRRAKVVKLLVAGVKSKLKASKVTLFRSEGRIVERKADGSFTVMAGDEEIEGRRLLIATGSSPIVPPIPGLREGIDSGFVLTNREVLTLPEVPGELVIIGGGVIGLEMASYYNTAGAHVTVIEMLDHIAGPTDGDISKALLEEYKQKGVTFMLRTKVVGISDKSVRCLADDGTSADISADKVLLSIGRRANVTGFGLEALGVEFSRSGIITDAQGRTNVQDMYAAGDVNGISMLAHTAYREAEVAVNTMLGKHDAMRYHAIPSVIYTYPEVAGVGHTSESALEAGIDFESRALSLRYAGRFVAESEGDGLCKVLIDKKYRHIIGVHIIGSYASEMIWGAAALMEMELTVRDIKQLVFPHPTISEIIREVIWEFD